MQPKADADFYAELLKRSVRASRRKEKGYKRALHELAAAPLAPAASPGDGTLSSSPVMRR